MAQPGVQVRSVITVAMVVAMIFCIVLLVSIAAAHLYGVFFLKPPDPNTHGGQGRSWQRRRSGGSRWSGASPPWPPCWPALITAMTKARGLTCATTFR